MKNFKNKEELTEWALNQFTKYGIRQPDTYTAAELKYLNPGVPTNFIDQHRRFCKMLQKETINEN